MLSITRKISDSKLAEFKTGFLRVHRVPVDEYGDPIMTEEEWIAEWGLRQYIRAYKEGKRQIAQQKTKPIFEDVIS